jgi:uncharacterized membrane protein YhfC
LHRACYLERRTCCDLASRASANARSADRHCDRRRDFFPDGRHPRVSVAQLSFACQSWFTTHRLVYAAYGIAAAALFEETGRLSALQFLAKRTVGPGAGLAYGIGHGGLESILIGVLPQARALYMAWMLNAGRFGEIAAGYSPIARQQIVGELDALTFLSATYAGVERLTALLIQIGLSLIVWRAVSHRRWALIAIAIVLHAAADAPAALLQAGYLAPLPSSFARLVPDRRPRRALAHRSVSLSSMRRLRR